MIPVLPSRATTAQFVRFGTAGAVISVLGGLTYLIPAVLLGTPPLLANLLSYLVAVAAGFVLHGRWSFAGHGGRDRPAWRALRFVAVSLLSLLLNSLWVWLLTDPAGLSPWWPVIPMALVTPLVTFGLHRHWVFG